MTSVQWLAIFQANQTLFMFDLYNIILPRSKNEPTTVAKKTEAATRKSQYLKFGLTQHYEMFHNVA